jgi:hypothetical protein
MGKPLLRADEIRTLADGQAILLSGDLGQVRIGGGDGEDAGEVVRLV